MTTSDDGLIAAHITKKFGGVVAADDVSIAVAPGRIRGLIGPNGAGKSTLLAIISGFQRPDAGSVRYGGRDLLKLRPSLNIAHLGIARTFQQATPLTGQTVFENAMVGMHQSFTSSVVSVVLRRSRAKQEERAASVRAHELLERFGLPRYSRVDAKDLTFGNLRLLEVARAIASRPKILLLDEPAAGLNRVETNELAAAITDLKESGVGVLVVDHDVPFVFDLCDDVTVMDFGKVIASGAASEVFMDPAVRQAYLGDAQLGRAAS